MKSVIERSDKNCKNVCNSNKQNFNPASCMKCKKTKTASADMMMMISGGCSSELHSHEPYSSSGRRLSFRTSLAVSVFCNNPPTPYSAHQAVLLHQLVTRIFLLLFFVTIFCSNEPDASAYSLFSGDEKRKKSRADHRWPHQPQNQKSGDPESRRMV